MENDYFSMKNNHYFIWVCFNVKYQIQIFSNTQKTYINKSKNTKYSGSPKIRTFFQQVPNRYLTEMIPLIKHSASKDSVSPKLTKNRVEFLKKKQRKIQRKMKVFYKKYGKKFLATILRVQLYIKQCSQSDILTEHGQDKN